MVSNTSAVHCEGVTVFLSNLMETSVRPTLASQAKVSFTLQYCSVVLCGLVWCSVVQCSAVWCSVV